MRDAHWRIEQARYMRRRRRRRDVPRALWLAFGLVWSVVIVTEVRTCDAAQRARVEAAR